MEHLDRSPPFVGGQERPLLDSLVGGADRPVASAHTQGRVEQCRDAGGPVHDQHSRGVPHLLNAEGLAGHLDDGVTAHQAHLRGILANPEVLDDLQVSGPR